MIRPAVEAVGDYKLVRDIGVGIGGFPNVIEAIGATQEMRRLAEAAALAAIEQDGAEVLAVLEAARDFIDAHAGAIYYTTTEGGPWPEGSEDVHEEHERLAALVKRIDALLSKGQSHDAG
jgi:hypothetical protein